jgi:rod shape-determining protein MreD
MRRIILSAVAVAIALVLQLTTINGLRLPGGGVPDLVLAVVVALGLAGGPVPGAVTGFAAGLCLDLAPPGSGVIGEYALVFCLAGWAAGRFRGSLARSALLPIAIAMAIVVAGEIMVAALGLALQPAQVSWTSVRQLLPAALFYDVAVSPFVLYLVLLAGAWLGDAPAPGRATSPSQARSLAGSAALAGRAGLPGRTGLAGPVGSSGGAVLLGLGGWLSGPPQSRRARRAAARRAPRLGSPRSGDGWIGGSAAARRALGHASAGQALGAGRSSARTLRGSAFRGPAFRGSAAHGPPLSSLARGSRPHGSSSARLRSGVAGSAAASQAPRTLAARPVHLRLAAGRRRDGALGNLLGGGRPRTKGAVVTGRAMSRGSMARLGRRRASRGGGFRPGLMPGGSASMRQQVRGLAPAGSGAARFGSGRSGGPRFSSGGSGGLRFGSGGSGGLRFSSDGSGGLRPGSARFGSGRSGGLRLGSGRSGAVRFGPARAGSARRRDGLVGGGVLAQIGRTGHRTAAPRFKIRSGGPLTAPGGLSPEALRSMRRRSSQQRLRIHPRRGDGMLGGSPVGARRPAAGLAGGRSRPATPRFRSRPLAGGRPPSGKRPRFGYRRWSVLSLLTRRHAGPLGPRRVSGRPRPGRPGSGRIGWRRAASRRTGGLR